ncbi:MAG: AAA family ATPase [Breznakibacter sp.]
MVEEHIRAMVLSNLGHVPTPSQKVLIDAFAPFITYPESDKVLVIKGFAGTGKTTVVSAFVKTLSQFKISSILMAPTGRAAKVMSSFAGQPAYTIHRKIYRQKSSSDGMGAFLLNFNTHKDTLFIVDEASLIANSVLEQSVFGSGRLLDDLFSYVFQGHNCKLILIGDTAQLPPVNFAESPALDKNVLKHYNVEVDEYTLTDVVRQTAQSGILENATLLRRSIGDFDKNAELPKFSVLDCHDMHRINGGELIEAISQCFDTYGLEETMVVCRSNKRAVLYNKGIRNSILFREEELTAGDLLLVVKNNYFWLAGNKEVDFIANGDIAEVVKVRKYEELHGLRFANITVRFVEHGYFEADVKIILDTLQAETPALSQAGQEFLYQSVMADYRDEKSKKAQFDKIRQDPYFNALQVKFAYAMTCHKSQGGQWKAVFVDQGMVADADKGVEYLRWLYTAVTRATEKVYLVNFPDDQFGN